MEFRRLFPLIDASDEFAFRQCLTFQDFLRECVSIFFSVSHDEERVKEACLSAYMAFRDHYPDYMEFIDQEMRERLDQEILVANSKIIKLRRIVIGSLAQAMNQARDADRKIEI